MRSFFHSVVVLGISAVGGCGDSHSRESTDGAVADRMIAYAQQIADASEDAAVPEAEARDGKAEVCDAEINIPGGYCGPAIL